MRWSDVAVDFRTWKISLVIGDQCIDTSDPTYPNGHPQLAQVAIQQGMYLAENLCRMKLGGWFAWAIRLIAHLRSILGVKNKLIVLLNWIWSYVIYDQSLRLILRTKLPR